MHKVLAIMESDALSSALGRALGEEFVLTRCKDAASGAELLEAAPDALILELFLPGVTGLTFLEENRERLPPVVLVLSPLITPYVVQSAERLGAGFLIRLPCTTNEIAMHLREMLREPDASDHIRSLLLALRLSPRLRGFLYLTEILRLFSADKQQRVTKDLYPVLARRHRTSPDAVEHAIRSCLRDAWNRRDPETWQRYFPGAQRCPSNREFIAVLAEFAQKKRPSRRKGNGLSGCTLNEIPQSEFKKLTNQWTRPWALSGVKPLRCKPRIRRYPGYSSHRRSHKPGSNSCWKRWNRSHNPHG